MKKFSATLVALLLVACITTAAASDIDVRLKRITLDDDRVDVGSTINLILELRNADDTALTTSDDIELTIYSDSTVVHEDTIHLNIPAGGYYNYSISSSSFETEDGDDVWSDNLLDYACGDHTIKAEIDGDVPSDSDDDDLEIEGNDLSFVMDPTTPSFDEDLRVIVSDEDGDDLKSAKVKITYLDSNDEWDADDDKTDAKSTNSNGEIVFKLDNEFKNGDAGMYQVDVWKSGYCKETTTFDLNRALAVTGPEPAQPMVGQSFSFRLTNQDGNAVKGAVATLNPGGYKATSDSQGYFRFTVNDARAYSLAVKASGYDDPTLISFTVSEKSSLAISIQPTQPAAGEPVTMTVLSEGIPLQSATVLVKLPDGTTQMLVSDGSGRAAFTPTQTGVYSINASKATYKDGTASFNVLKKFNIILPNAEEYKAGNDVTVTVQDTAGNPISAATVTLVGTGITGATDPSGRYNFKLPSSGEYTVRVTKEGFATLEKKLNSMGILAIRLSSKNVELGDGAIVITVLDSFDNKVSGAIVVSKPDGTKDTFSSDEYSYKPAMAGEHNVTVSKANYAPTTESFTVGKKTVTLDMKIDGNMLTITALSGNETVPDLTILVRTPTAESEVVTDVDGTVMMAANDKGEYSAIAKSETYDSGKVVVRKNGVLPKVDYKILAILAAIIILAAIVVVAIAVIYYHRRKKGTLGTASASKLKKIGLV